MGFGVRSEKTSRCSKSAANKLEITMMFTECYVLYHFCGGFKVRNTFENRSLQHVQGELIISAEHSHKRNIFGTEVDRDSSCSEGEVLR